MRVSNNILSHNLLSNLEQSNQKMVLLQNQLATGNKITKPSDDPIGTETIIRFNSSITTMEQWKTNADEAIAYLQSSESVLSGMTSMLQRIRELTVQGANGSLSNDDRSQIAKEVDQLNMQFQVMANSQVNSKYIFSGSKIDTPPLSGSATVPFTLTQWEGNDKVIQMEVGPNVAVGVAIEGSKLFGITHNGDGTESSSFFSTLNKLSSALTNGDETQINEALAEVDDHLDNFLALRSELGARTNRMSTIGDQLVNNVMNLKQNLSAVRDADLAETIMDFNAVNNTYKAALSVGAQIIQPSLVDFIR
ncbi:flagellar hook-associated protein FlgL [Dehalobacter sp. DCM]|uniref:flagellar hook-associated protein FlgL n=1 Tax=Dehalobacter sp. DCM TaxID=2907827 RepID=UPI003081B29D|nr:flagellar hook-associated protein FlgL [Dehalobacter sp. DCM]